MSDEEPTEFEIKHVEGEGYNMAELSEIERRVRRERKDMYFSSQIPRVKDNLVESIIREKEVTQSHRHQDFLTQIADPSEFQLQTTGPIKNKTLKSCPPELNATLLNANTLPEMEKAMRLASK